MACDYPPGHVHGLDLREEQSDNRIVHTWRINDFLLRLLSLRTYVESTLSTLSLQYSIGV